MVSIAGTAMCRVSGSSHSVGAILGSNDNAVAAQSGSDSFVGKDNYMACGRTCKTYHTATPVATLLNWFPGDYWRELWGL